MRVQALQELQIDGEPRTRRKGEVFELPDEQAARLLREGVAKPWRDPAPTETK